MKKLLSVLCLLTLCVLIPSAALAMTQEEWNQECRAKTKGSTTLYATGEDGTLTVIGTLPGGVYIKLGSYDYDLHLWDIAYWSNGARASAWVKRDNVTSAETMVHFTDGTSVSLPEALAGDAAALAAYVSRQYPGRTLTNVPPAPELPTAGESSRPDDSSSSADEDTQSDSRPSSSSSAASGIPAAGLTAQLDGATVPVLRLGVYESVILLGDAERTVLTASLTFAGGVPADKAVAVIHAPRTGKCTLRQKASDSAKALGQCKAGTIVAVLEYGRRYCKVSCDGEVGYVLTSCLKFYGGAHTPAGTGVLTWNGKATGRTKINIRNAADGDANKVAEWRTGTEVIVFGRVGSWYEIEHEGMHGYVHEDYLTPKEEEAP